MSTKPLSALAGACAAILIPCISLAQDPATPGSVSKEILNLLERAAESEGGLHLETVVLLAIGANPAKASDILAAIAELAPERLDSITTAAQAAFPDLALSRPGSPPPVTAAIRDSEDAAQAARETMAEQVEKPQASFWNLSAWTGEAELSGARSTGNTDQLTVGLAGKAAREIGDWRHKFEGLVDFEKSHKETTRRRWLVNYEPNYSFSDRAYTFGFFQYENDAFGSFDYRFSESIGIGYQLIQTENVTFNVEGGPGARHIRYVGEDLTTEFTGLFRSALEWRLTEDSTITHDFAFFWGTNQETIDSRATLRMRINGALSGRISYNYRYNSNASPTAHKVDTTTRAALVYEF